MGFLVENGNYGRTFPPKTQPGPAPADGFVGSSSRSSRAPNPNPPSHYQEDIVCSAEDPPGIHPNKEGMMTNFYYYS